MQCEIRGHWVYVLSGRIIHDTRPEAEPNDPFEVVHAFRADEITGVRVNQGEFTIDIFVKGHTSPIHCWFGRRNCHKINTYGMFLQKLVQLLELDVDLIWGQQVRDPEVSQAMTRKDCSMAQTPD